MIESVSQVWPFRWDGDERRTYKHIDLLQTEYQQDDDDAVGKEDDKRNAKVGEHFCVGGLDWVRSSW